jgi:hypothetical protein
MMPNDGLMVDLGTQQRSMIATMSAMVPNRSTRSRPAGRGWTISQRGVFDVFQIPYSAVERQHEAPSRRRRLFAARHPGMIYDAQSLQIGCVGHSLLAALP